MHDRAKHLRAAVVACLLICAPLWRGAAYAQLVWEFTEQKLVAKPDQATAVVEYPFRNAGDKPVKITSVRTSCGCTLTRLAKRTYKPGERGRLDATFVFGHRMGQHTKIIWVRTDASEPRGTLLLLRVNIPEIVRMRPRCVLWSVAGPASTETILFQILHDKPIRVVKVTASRPDLDVSFQEVERGKQYAIRVKPGKPLETMRASLTVQTDYPRHSPRAFLAYARVLAPVQAGTGKSSARTSAGSQKKTE